MLTEAQTALLAETLQVSLRHAAASSDDAGWSRSLTDAGAALPTVDNAHRPRPHAALPALGSSTEQALVVAEADTAAAMGHPDTSVDVLGSPRLALWFEIVASGLLPAPTAALTHVGAGVVVHHLAPARIDEEVTVQATAESVAGRRVVFSCTATVGARCVALGVHHRVVLEREG